MWSKFDDQFYLNPKNATIDRDEQDLYIAGIIYCNGQLTDGFIPSSVLMMLYTWAKLPFEANAQANAQAIASRLVEHRLWEVVQSGYMVHDFLDWNMSKEKVLQLKNDRSNAGRRGGQRSGEVRSKNEANAQAIAKAKPKQKRTQSQSQSLKNKDSERSEISDKFTDVTKIMAYDLDKWVEAEQTMNRAGVLPDEIEIAINKLKGGDKPMSVTGLWSITRTAIEVHADRIAGRPVNSNGNKPISAAKRRLLEQL